MKKFHIFILLCYILFISVSFESKAIGGNGVWGTDIDGYTTYTIDPIITGNKVFGSYITKYFTYYFSDDIGLRTYSFADDIQKPSIYQISGGFSSVLSIDYTYTITNKIGFSAVANSSAGLVVEYYVNWAYRYVEGENITFNIHYSEISKASLAVFSSSLKIIERVVTKTQTYAFGILLNTTYSNPMDTTQFFTIDYDIAPIFDTSFPNCPALPWETDECHLMQQYTPQYLAYIPSNLREYYYIIN